MNKDWQAYAKHVQDTIAKLERIQQRGDLTNDEMLYDAALRNLQTLSEATQRLPDSLKERFSEIPWKEISGFRNILVHKLPWGYRLADGAFCSAEAPSTA